MRQTFLRALVEHYGYPQSLIAVEAQISVGAGLTKRCDAVVYSRDLQPLMLIEFKADHVALTAQVLDQAAIYNTTVHAPWLILANGKQTVVAHVDASQQITFLNHIPSWTQLLP